MQNNDCAYGSVRWLEERFRESDEDPWGHHFRGAERYRYVELLRFLSRATRGTAGRKMLDVGCSTGEFTRMLFGLAGRVIGIDVSPTAVARGQKKYPHLDLRVSSLPDCRFTASSFDVITCLEMLYYLDRDRQDRFLTEAAALLKERGVALFSSFCGKHPYFSAAELVGTVNGHFRVLAVRNFGSSIYARGEGFLFAKYLQVGKILRILSAASAKERTQLLSRLKDRKAAAMLSRMARSAIFRVAVERLMRGIGAMLRTLLTAEKPARWADRLSGFFRLRRSHTFVLAAKRESVRERMIVPDEPAQLL